MTPDGSTPGVLLVGTLDTKGPEITWIAREIERLGCSALILDSGVRGEATVEGATITREQVAAAAQSTLEELGRLPRGEALDRMAAGVRAIALRLAEAGTIEGALCVGGAGVSLAVPAFQALPLGFPKLIVTPLASGDRTFDFYVGTADVAVMHSVADIMGLNAVTLAVFSQAAGFITGAVLARRGTSLESAGSGRLIAASMNGNTTPALMYAKDELAARGFELVTFHANGAGGRAMEQHVKLGMFVAVIDYTTTELAGHDVGGLMNAGADRMEAAGRLGLPQILVPGCLDFITTGLFDDTAAAYPDRLLYRHNPALTLVRLTAGEMAGLGRRFAEKANGARGLVTICVPLGGLSAVDYPGGPFWDPEADAAFLEALMANIERSVRVECVDAHINDHVFVDRVVALTTETILASERRLSQLEVNQ